MIQQIDTRTALDPAVYSKTLRRFQKAFAAQVDLLKQQNRPAVLLFEGWGAAGKGDIIRLVTARLDPKLYSVHANHRPEGADANHHYLWRYWRIIPEQGRMAIFDRSWYRRVLIDRIDSACSEKEWKRAYQEINQIERQLIDFGCVLVKFWLQISPEEQLRRFESRTNDASRRWKIGPDDWQRRKVWVENQAAVNDMLAATSTVYAPWVVVDSDIKTQANLKTFQALITVFSDELKYNPLEPDSKNKLVKKKPKRKTA
jgi:AMP-polyphosphate phosphotransferase